MSYIKFIDSSKGKKILIYEDHKLIKDKEVDGISYWHCKFNDEKGCKSRITLVNNALKKQPKKS